MHSLAGRVSTCSSSAGQPVRSSAVFVAACRMGCHLWMGDMLGQAYLVADSCAVGSSRVKRSWLLTKKIHVQRSVQCSRSQYAVVTVLCRGKGKMRNRRYVLRKGPLVVFGSDHGISKAFRNLPGERS